MKKANQKVHVLARITPCIARITPYMARITPYMSIHKRKLLMHSFFISQFKFDPLVWMCHSRLMNNKINRLNEKYLRIVYSGKTLFFEELLDKDRSATIHIRNLQVLATKFFKVYRNLSPTIVAEILSRSPE